MFFKWLKSIKYRLSHISETSWHWQAVEMFFSENAYGRACTYYWFKLPLSLLLLLSMVVVYIVVMCFVIPGRLVAVALAWFFGYRFNENVFNISMSVTSNRNYYSYKTRPNGTETRFAPWEYALVLAALWILWIAIFVRPEFGKGLLNFTIGIGVGLVLIYFVTASWKNPTIIRLRANVREAYDKVCPMLVVGPTSKEVSVVDVLPESYDN